MKGGSGKSSRLIYIILISVCICCFAACLYLGSLYRNIAEDDGAALESLRDSIKQYESIAIDANTTEPVTYEDTEQPETDAVYTDTAEPLQSEEDIYTPAPIGTLDFTTLWDINSEIHAWIEISGTKIDYPVLQSKDNDTKYLTTAYDGSRYIGGAIFTQALYNNDDFDDPVTVIYGHTMRSGTMFGQLQKTYSDAASFAKNKNIKIYLPGENRNYKVFAAVPYDSIHILHTYDFSNDYWYNRFFDDVSRIREFGANFRRDAFPEAGDRVIILSVCLNEDTARRYLVMAALDTDLADNAAKK